MFGHVKKYHITIEFSKINYTGSHNIRKYTVNCIITLVINLRWDAFVGVIFSRFGTGILGLLSLSNYFII